MVDESLKAQEPKLEVSIPDPTPAIKQLESTVAKLERRINRFSMWLGVAIGIAFLSIFIMVIGIAVETWRFSSIQYTEYKSDKAKQELLIDSLKNREEIGRVLNRIECQIRALDQRTDESGHMPLKKVEGNNSTTSNIR